MAQQKTNIWIDGTQAGATLGELKKKVNALNREIKDLPRNSDEYKKKVGELKQANQALDAHRKEIRGIGDAYGSAKTGIRGLIQEFSPFTGSLGLMVAGIGSVVTGTMSWLKNNREMEKSLSSLKAITGATAEDLKFYKEQAIEISKSSQTSSIDIVKGFELIGSARPELLKNKDALAQVTKEAVILSEAAGMDLADAAQSLAGTMNQFNVGAEHSRRIINALAAGSLEGASGISQVTESIDAFGAVAASSNVTIEESIALVEVLGDKNIKGAEAGTKLRNVLINVATASALPKEALDSMAQYGVNLDIVQDKTLPLEVRLKELAKVQGDQNALVKIFGKENVVAGQTILTNIDRFKELTDSVTGTNTALEQQEAMNDNLDGSIKKLGNAWEAYTLSLNGSEGVTKIFKDLLNFLAANLTSVISVLSKLVLGFVSYKAILGGARLMQVLFNAELRKQVFGFNQVAGATDAAGKSVKNYGAAMKAIGWTVLIALVIDQAMAFWDVASGAADARDAVERYNKAISDGQKFGQESVDKINQRYEAEKQNLDLLASKTKEKGGISEAEHKKRLAELENEIDARIKGEIRLANETKAQAKKSGRTDIVARENETLKQLIKLQKDRAKAEVDTEIEKNKEISQLSDEQKKKNEQNQKLADQKREKLNKDLLKLIEEAEELSQEEKFKKFLSSYDEGLEKELLLLKRSINDKYEAEIALAEQLEQEKGDIATKAAEAKKVLLNTMQEELERESLALTKKYNDEKKKADLEAQKEGQEIMLSNQESFEKNLAELKVSQAKLALSQIQEGDLSGQRKAAENIKIAEQNKKEITKKWQLIRLEESEKVELLKLKELHEKKAITDEQYEEQKKIVVQDFIVQREQLETDSQEQLVEKQAETWGEMLGISQETLNKISEGISVIGGVMKQYSDSRMMQSEQELAKVENQYKKEKKALDAKLKSGRISEQTYNAEVEKLDKDYANEKLKLEKEQFEIQKQAKLIDIAINTANGAVAALSAGPIAGPILATAAITFGAIQAGIVSQQEFPEVDQFAEGGASIPVRGKKDGKLYNAQNAGRIPSGMTPLNPSLVLVSENEPEYFVGGELLRNRRVANYVGMIEAIRTNKVNQFADGGFSIPVMANSSMDDKIIQQNTAIMRLLYEELRKGVRVDFSQKRIEELEKEQSIFSSIK